MADITRENVLVWEAGLEMDALIHLLVMGERVEWQRRWGDFGDYVPWMWTEFPVIKASYCPTTYDHWVPIPAYSTDMNMAWRVVEKVGLNVVPIYAFDEASQTYKRVGWGAVPVDSFGTPRASLFEGHVGWVEFVVEEGAQAPIAPLAIGRAALLATLVKE